MGERTIPPFSLRLTFEERAKLERDAAGMALGAYIRSRLLDPETVAPRKRGKFPVKDHQALAQLLGLLGQSRLANNVNQLAKAAGVRPKEQAFNEEEVEGSDELGMVSILAAYEGSYADLLHFLRELDKANRLVIIESLAASPQQGTGVLNISLRLNTFIRETPLPQVAVVTPPAGGAQ